MSLRKPINVVWKGKEYSLLVTMEVIDRLEDKINLGMMAARVAEGDIRFSHAAKLIAAILNESGAKVSADEVYSEMFGGGEVSPKDVGVMIGAIFSAVFPEPKKKAELLTEKPVKAKPNRSSGRTSTK